MSMNITEAQERVLLSGETMLFYVSPAPRAGSIVTINSPSKKYMGYIDKVIFLEEGFLVGVTL